MEPGWYPDPFANGLRWWDGRTWTGHTAPATSGFYQLDPHKDLRDEHVAARRASIAVVVAAVIGAVDEFVAAFVFGDYLHKLFVETTTVNGVVTPPPTPGGVIAAEYIGVAGYVAQVFVMIWLYRAAKFARNAGLPARRDPVWAVLGFIIPIVNFWFPYQLAADSFAHGDPRRRLAGWWWTWYLISIAFALAVAIASAFSTAAGVIVAVLGAAVYALSATYAWRMIAAVGAAHGELLASSASR